MNYQEILSQLPEDQKKTVSIQFPGTLPGGRLYFGCGTFLEIGKEAKKLEATKAVIITGPTLVSLGIADLAAELLAEEGIQSVVFDQVPPEPHLDTMKEAAAMVRQEKADLIIGLGGGSPMDTAKLAAVAGANVESVDELVQNSSEAINASLPTILIPTTSGTGSEVSPYIVYSDGGRKGFVTSAYTYATIALIDPLLTATMPPSVTAATGLDALTHGMEGATGKTNPYTLAMSSRCAELTFRFLPRAVKDGNDIEARTGMAFASILGMLAYTQGGGLYAHSISYILTIEKDCAHGLGCGLALPYTLRYNREMIPELLYNLQESINRSDDYHADSADEVIAQFKKLTEDIGMPSDLKAVGYTEDDMPAFADTLVTKYYRANNPRSMSPEEALTLSTAMLNGTLDF